MAQGHRVHVLDDLSTGSLENISPLINNPRLHFTHGSVLEPGTLDFLVRECDEIYHLGAVVGVKIVFEDPCRTIRVNVAGTENALEAAVRYAKRILIASTSEVYGRDFDSRSKAFRESDSLSLGTSPRWSYACSKALGEYLAISLHKKSGLPVVIARIFNTIGIRQSGAYGMVVQRLIEQALSGQPITVYGDGEQTRTFIWVRDTVRALVGLMESSAAAGGIFNIGSEEEVRIEDVALKIIDLRITNGI